jgi:nonsense-mediated mRNA decay protein 3
MFCVECGSEGELYKSLCRQCYLEKNRFITLPKTVDVVMCPHCGARQKGKGWTQSDSDNMELLVKDIIIENAKLHDDVEGFEINITLDHENETNMDAKVISQAELSGLKAREEHKVRLRIRPQVCPECSRQEGGYWEAKVQLRGSEKGLNKEEEERALDVVESLVVSREKERGAFVTKMERMHGGLDFYLGSNSLGKLVSKELAQTFGGSVKESHKLVGRKDGKDVYRTTHAVRMSQFSLDDFVRIDEQIFQVKKTSPDSVLLRALESGKDFWFHYPDLERVKMIGGKELVKDMVVVSRSEGEIQVLDPDNLKTEVVLVPSGFDTGTESVRIMKCEIGYFFVE